MHLFSPISDSTDRSIMVMKKFEHCYASAMDQLFNMLCSCIVAREEKLGNCIV